MGAAGGLLRRAAGFEGLLGVLRCLGAAALLRGLGLAWVVDLDRRGLRVGVLLVELLARRARSLPAAPGHHPAERPPAQQQAAPQPSRNPRRQAILLAQARRVEAVWRTPWGSRRPARLPPAGPEAGARRSCACLRGAGGRIMSPAAACNCGSSRRFEEWRRRGGSFGMASGGFRDARPPGRLGRANAATGSISSRGVCGVAPSGTRGESGSRAPPPCPARGITSPHLSPSASDMIARPLLPISLSSRAPRSEAGGRWADTSMSETHPQTAKRCSQAAGLERTCAGGLRAATSGQTDGRTTCGHTCRRGSEQTDTQTLQAAEGTTDTRTGRRADARTANRPRRQTGGQTRKSRGGRTCGRTGRRTDAQAGGGAHGRTGKGTDTRDGRTNGRTGVSERQGGRQRHRDTDRRTNRPTDPPAEGRADGRTDGRTDGRSGRPTDRRTDRQRDRQGGKLRMALQRPAAHEGERPFSDTRRSLEPGLLLRSPPGGQPSRLTCQGVCR